MATCRDGVESVAVFHDVHGGPLKVRNHTRHAKKARAETLAELHMKRGAHGGVRMTGRSDIVFMLYPLSLEVKEEPFRGQCGKLKVVKGTVYIHGGVVAAKKGTDMELPIGYAVDQQALAWRFRAFAERRMTEFVRSWDDARIEALYAGHARQRREDADLFAALLVGTAGTVLGVGISLGDSVLIHGVRLIAEKLGPRSVSVHTNLRNACNEVWRGIIIQRNIDCSPLHLVIPALLASLSTDSFLLVDDPPAPMLSEDNVHQSALLATASYCVAIHPEIEECDITLQVADGAATRFNADDGYSMALPEHVWPGFHAFRTSNKAYVVLEMRFDKMHTYNADMEAARREALAVINWPQLDGHHGIPVLNVPLGSPWYVLCMPTCLRGKAEELQEEVDAILSKLISATPSRRGGYFDENAVETAREMRLHFPTRLKGDGTRHMATVHDATFICCMNDILPMFFTRSFDTNTLIP
eukprot:jgi/Tetstr1/427305/TSEL_017474.t1